MTTLVSIMFRHRYLRLMLLNSILIKMYIRLRPRIKIIIHRNVVQKVETGCHFWPRLRFRRRYIWQATRLSKINTLTSPGGEKTHYVTYIRIMYTALVWRTLDLLVFLNIILYFVVVVRKKYLFKIWDVGSIFIWDNRFACSRKTTYSIYLRTSEHKLSKFGSLEFIILLSCYIQDITWSRKWLKF